MEIVEVSRARPAIHSVSAPAPAEASAFPAPLLLEATRVAGMFQRSALGHLDHREWLDRVGKDGQRLMDVLAQMGFAPSGRQVVKSA